MKLKAGAACVVAAALAVTACVLACATTPLRAPVADVAALPSSRALAGVDWRAAGDEAFADLRSYLMADTTNPPGNERRGAEVLAALLANDGIEASVQPLHDAPERANLIARLPASAPSGQGALCLVSHLDVVSAEPTRWPAGRGPFDGAVSTDDASGEQLLWGRGALDMMVLGRLEVATVRWL
jgi:hypothetical protein